MDWISNCHFSCAVFLVSNYNYSIRNWFIKEKIVLSANLLEKGWIVFSLVLAYTVPNWLGFYFQPTSHLVKVLEKRFLGKAFNTISR